MIPDSIKCPDCTAEEVQALCVETQIREQIVSFNEGREDCDRIEKALIEVVETHPENCVYASKDDVGVDHQKETRKIEVVNREKWLKIPLSIYKLQKDAICSLPSA